MNSSFKQFFYSIFILLDTFLFSHKNFLRFYSQFQYFFYLILPWFDVYSIFYLIHFVLFNTGTGLQKYVDDLSNCIGSSERIVQTPGKYLISLFNLISCCALLHCVTVVVYFLLFWSTLLSALLWSPLFCSVLLFSILF